MEAEASADLEQYPMTTRVTSLRPEGLPLFVTVVYGKSDVDLAAEHLGVALSDAETKSVLTNLDEELPSWPVRQPVRRSLSASLPRSRGSPRPTPSTSTTERRTASLELPFNRRAAPAA